MLDITDMTGSYTESGQWWDSEGKTGQLQGNIDVSAEGDQLAFNLDGGHVMQAGPVQGRVPTVLEGTGGGVNTSGTLYVGETTLILEYSADGRGRHERNTDVWDFSGSGLRRAGIIRQNQRTIWFEVTMLRAP